MRLGVQATMLRLKDMHVQGLQHAATLDAFLGTHEQLRQALFPMESFDHIFMAAAAMHLDDNPAIDAILRSRAQAHVHMFMVTAPPLLAEQPTHLCRQETNELVEIQAEPATIAPEKQWTTDLDASQAALLQADNAQHGVAHGDAAHGHIQTLDEVAAEGVAIHASEAGVGMEEASHVAIVSEDRGSFLHRCKVLLEHLVLVRSPKACPDGHVDVHSSMCAAVICQACRWRAEECSSWSARQE
ncbi:MAG: hypothetical protein HC767_04960 [Akkermansiaceae bacterium]|nr:hypothetical protein [Akkermansiaceae bacterium]